MKKKYVIFVTACLLCNFVFGHTIDYTIIIPHHWSITADNAVIDGSFLMIKDGNVYIEKASNETAIYPLSSLSDEDKSFALGKAEKVRRLNSQLKINQNFKEKNSNISIYKMWVSAAFMVLFMVIFIVLLASRGNNYINSAKFKYAYPILLVGVVTSLFGFSKSYKTTNTTNPYYIDSAFAPYHATVTTHWDTIWFYVESYGIPAQEMMAGITNWQQQVPIPQCYTGANAWSIPLSPVLATTPVPTAHHFFRGAIAIAANGVPIFNALTNTGVDAYLDGQLDNYGGHCGRADDYHYHIAPLQLQDSAGNKPIAFALDGFAVYGSVEPNGAAMTALDTNHGHFWSGVYHYHGTMTYPYMIGNMVGRVTEDTTFQIIPQAAAHPVRPGQTPLPGAVINQCQQIGTNGYKLIYTHSGQSDTISYSWTPGGIYNFHFISPTTGTTTQTYTGFIPCYVLPTAANETIYASKNILLYPNPAHFSFSLSANNQPILNEITDIAIFNMTGQLVYKSKTYSHAIETSNLPKGTYTVTFKYFQEQLTRKLVVQ